MDQTDAQKLPILLLAAGRARRMRGTDKLLETVDGMPLLRRAAQMARMSTDGPVFVTMPTGAVARASTLDGLDVTPVSVTDAALGMSASLRAGLAALPMDAPAAMILLADMPELERTDLRAVLNAVAAHPQARIWRGATQAGAPGHPLVIHADLFRAFQALTGDTGGRDILAAHRAETVLVPLPGHRARCDLDTPEDWATWRKMRK